MTADPGDYHIAQLNIATLLAPIDDPSIADFTDNLERINALGDGHPGFVWRLQTDEGDATALRALSRPDGHREHDRVDVDRGTQGLRLPNRSR